MPRNYDPKLHPFEVAREYQRTLNAVKLDKIFAKPFVGSLEGHSDVVECLMKHPTSLSTLVSGSSDGEIKIWNLPTKKCLRSIKRAHEGIVRGLCAPRDGSYFFSIDSSCCIKQWRMPEWSILTTDEDSDDDDDVDPSEPINTIIGKGVTMHMDHHYKKSLFMTCGERVELWEETRPEPLKSYMWGVDSVHCVKFNPVETDVCCSASSDRSIILYDIRKSSPIRKMVMEMRSNKIAWNPMAAFNFSLANEDYKYFPRVIHCFMSSTLDYPNPYEMS